MIPTDFLFLFIIRVVFFLWSELSESNFILFLFFYSIRVGPSRSELIRPELAVQVDPVRLLYLPLAHIYIAMGTRKTFLEQGLRTNNKFNAIYAFTSTVFKPGIHSPCWKVHAATLSSAIHHPCFAIESDIYYFMKPINNRWAWGMCLKKVKPQDKQSWLHRVSMTTCEQEPPGTVTLNISENFKILTTYLSCQEGWGGKVRL